MTPHVPPIGEDDLLAYVDERLDDSRRAHVEAYLEANPEMRARVEADRHHRAALRAALQPIADEPVPARLRIASIRAARATRHRRALRNIAAALALFITGAAGGFAVRSFLPAMDPTVAAVADAAPPAMRVARAASSAFHTFVVEVVHPVEVDSSREAHLMGWLSKRLGRPLAAPDLSGFGYRLMGGRLLPAGEGAAAQLMYDNASGQRLTLYIQAMRGTETAFRFAEQNGAGTFAWIDQGFGFAVTGMESRARLLPIAEAVYHALDGGRGTTREG